MADQIRAAYRQMLIESFLINEQVLMEDRIDFLKANTKPLDTSHDPHAVHQDTDKIIDHFAEHGDPSKNKVHTQFILGLYKAKALRQEDAYRVKDALTEFDRHKSKLSPEDKQLTLKKYPTIASITQKVAPFSGMGATNAEQQKIDAAKDHDVPGHEKMYEDGTIKIYRLTDKETSQKLYGKANDQKPGVYPTDWCTATQSNDHNMFDHYTKDGNLHVVHRKSDGEVFQYHVSGDQFMDKNDNEISKEDFVSIKPSLHKAWKEKPELLASHEQV